jgi:hypothetical protein
MTAPVDIGRLSCCFDWFCWESIAIWTCTAGQQLSAVLALALVVVQAYTDGNLDLGSTDIRTSIIDY